MEELPSTAETCLKVSSCYSTVKKIALRTAMRTINTFGMKGTRNSSRRLRFLLPIIHYFSLACAGVLPLTAATHATSLGRVEER